MGAGHNRVTLVYLLPHGEKQRLPSEGRRNRSSVRTEEGTVVSLRCQHRNPVPLVAGPELAIRSMSTSAHQVLRALSNRVYAGELTFRSITATGCHDPLEEESVFDEAERF